ncbi:MBG domain-containing protein, partial [Lacticaseibacillus hegangensis]|uniref:MBG domain-containing protein n=1 Tax=Lacticaseibacillus hegangensis TaxID=2486010 RepID=UPI0013DDD9F0
MLFNQDKKSHLQTAMADKKIHFKMYKSGKLWLYAGITLLGLTQFAFSPKTVQADTIPTPETEAVTKAAASTTAHTTDQAVKLATSDSSTASTAASAPASAASSAAQTSAARASAVPAAKPTITAAELLSKLPQGTALTQTPTQYVFDLPADSDPIVIKSLVDDYSLDKGVELNYKQAATQQTVLDKPGSSTAANEVVNSGGSGSTAMATLAEDIGTHMTVNYVDVYTGKTVASADETFKTATVANSATDATVTAQMSANAALNGKYTMADATSLSLNQKTQTSNVTVTATGSFDVLVAPVASSVNLKVGSFYANYGATATNTLYSLLNNPQLDPNGNLVNQRAVIYPDASGAATGQQTTALRALLGGNDAKLADALKNLLNNPAYLKVNAGTNGTNGGTKDVGKYTYTITDTGRKLISDTLLKLTKGKFTLATASLTGAATTNTFYITNKFTLGTGTHIYDGQTLAEILPSLPLYLDTLNPAETASRTEIKNVGLTASDFTFSNGASDVSDAATYKVSLNNSGLAKVQAAYAAQFPDSTSNVTPLDISEAISSIEISKRPANAIFELTGYAADSNGDPHYTTNDLKLVFDVPHVDGLEDIVAGDKTPKYDPATITPDDLNLIQLSDNQVVIVLVNTTIQNKITTDNPNYAITWTPSQLNISNASDDTDTKTVSIQAVDASDSTKLVGTATTLTLNRQYRMVSLSSAAQGSQLINSYKIYSNWQLAGDFPTITVAPPAGQTANISTIDESTLTTTGQNVGDALTAATTVETTDPVTILVPVVLTSPNVMKPAPTEEGTTSDSKKLYAETHKTYTVTATGHIGSADGEEVAQTDAAANQTFTFTRTYEVDAASGKATGKYGEWTLASENGPVEISPAEKTGYAATPQSVTVAEIQAKLDAFKVEASTDADTDTIDF